MTRKLLFIVAMLVAVMAHASGAWKVHPFYVTSKAQNNIETRNKIIYLVSGNVYSYDKATGATEALNNSNVLSDITVTAIYYNYLKDYMLLTYDNSNIDIITGDGRIINIPEIKNAIVTQSKVINDVTFDDGHAYIATDFGFAVLNDNTMTINETHFYGKAIETIVHAGGKIVVCVGGNLYYSNDNDQRDSFNDLMWMGQKRNKCKFFPIDDSRFFINANDSIQVCTITGSNFAYKKIGNHTATSIQRTPTGFIANISVFAYYTTTDDKGENIVMRNQEGILTSNPYGDGTLWVLDSTGLHKINDDGATKPTGIGISTVAYWTNYCPVDNRFYLASTTDNAILPTANKGAKTEIWAYDGTTWEDVTPPNVPVYNNGADGYQGNYWMDFVPGKSDYVVALRSSGIIYVRNNNIVTRFYRNEKAPFVDKYKCTTAIDEQGNLWAIQSYKTDGKAVWVLPAEKFADPANVVSTDWVLQNVSGIDVQAFKRACFAIGKRSTIKIFASGEYQKPVIFWDDNGDINTASPTTRSYSQLKGTDGRSVSWEYTICMLAASDGKVWLGTNSGIVAFDPKDAFNDDFLVDHMKVVNDDGTPGDYLVDGLQVNAIAEDKLHRKLIGTFTDGLYIVSPDGTRVLEHFTTDNSVLQNNCIFNIAYNPTTHSALIVTMNGVCEYFLDAEQGYSDYSNAKVYPNPVRPNFTGYVTIDQLVDNSTVEIVNTQGVVVKELTSDGSKCYWDCNDATGHRVPTGNYTVRAATGSDTPTPVATLLILN